MEGIKIWIELYGQRKGCGIKSELQIIFYEVHPNRGTRNMKKNRIKRIRNSFLKNFLGMKWNYRGIKHIT